MGFLNIFRKRKEIVKRSSRKEAVTKINVETVADHKQEEQLKNSEKENIKYLYEHPENLVEIEFFNRTKRTVNIWIELACESIDLDQQTEYKIVSHDRFFRMEFDENHVVFYLQTSFGFKLYKRPISQKKDWELEFDISEIN